jgi:putative transposase
MNYPIHYPHFFTATILEWKHLLKPDKFKDIIINSLQYLVQQNRVQVYSFVIMSNHIHIIWRMGNAEVKAKLQQSFTKFTAQKILQELRNNHPNVLSKLLVDAADRKYQVWERNPLSIEIHNHSVMLQKINYIHQNPVRAGLVSVDTDYHYSSANFYVNNTVTWNFITKWNA